MPVPVSAFEVGELAASLMNDICSDTAPADCGAKVTVKGRLWPAARVVGKLMPVIENPLPLPVTDDMVTDEEPAESVPLWALLLPTATLPKFEGDKETTS